MGEALLITLGSVLLGGGLAAATRRGASWLGVLRSFAIAAVAMLAAVQLLPEAVEQLGARALLIFLGAVALPPLFAYALRRMLGARAQATAHGVGAELGYFGFVAHQFVEGLALGTYSGPAHVDHDHVEIVLAVAAHTIPLTALFIGTVLARRGPAPALRRIAALLLASALGFLTAGWVTASVAEALAPVVAALVAGFLCHVLLHPSEHTATRSAGVRTLELVALVAGIALPLGSVHSHDAGGGIHDRLQHTWLELALETAPMLLLGLVLGAVLQVIGARAPTRWLRRGTPLRQALRGIAIGAPLPLCACGVLPIAAGLRRRGAPAALLVAFLISTPELGPETLTLGVRFLGWPYALARLGAALALAIVAGLVFAALVERPAVAAVPDGDVLGDRPPGAALRTAWEAFDELLLHTAPWTIVGLLAAAFLEIAVPTEGLAALADTGLDIIVVALVALPTYVCAASATPMAAVLLLKGVSPGAVLVGLLLGPATNVATVAVLGRSYGRRATALGIVAIAIASCVMGVLVNILGVPVSPPRALEQAHSHGWIAWGALALVGAALVRQLWRDGVQSWLDVIDGGAHAHLHAQHHGDPMEHDEHDHAQHHDHAHDHAHDHDRAHDHDHDDRAAVGHHHPPR
ncbi:MAG: permease [Nannocystaceae bacterium]